MSDQTTVTTTQPLAINLSNDIEGKVYVEGETLEELSKRLREYSDEVAIGASKMARGFGEVRQVGSRTLVARISYNGRIWNLDGSEHKSHRGGA